MKTYAELLGKYLMIPTLIKTKEGEDEQILFVIPMMEIGGGDLKEDDSFCAVNRHILLKKMK